jgi:DNA-binding CsgD family transcriptional regulator
MKGPGFSHTIISAARVSDLIGIVKSLEPDLIILCFRNNQHVLNDLDTFVKKPEIPVVCLAKKSESESLSWNSSSIVFSYPVEHLAAKEYLSSRINSIFLLRTKPKSDPVFPFAAAARQPDHFINSDDLSRYVMELDQKVEVLMRVKERIAHLYPRVDDPTRAELTSIVNSIRLSANDNKLWDDFKLYFEKTNPDFLFQLVQKHPGLTPKDLKYCCYLKMNMANDDIRTLLGINQESVRTHKYRLKKKLVLTKEQDLSSYLRSVGRS